MAHEIFTPHHLADELSEEEAKAYKAIMKRNEEQRKAMEAPFSERNSDLRMLQQFQALQQLQLACFAGSREAASMPNVPYNCGGATIG